MPKVFTLNTHEDKILYHFAFGMKVYETEMFLKKILILLISLKITFFNRFYLLFLQCFCGFFLVNKKKIKSKLK